MVERQEQVAPDAMMTRIGQAVMLHHGGDREEARHRLLKLWAEIGEDGDPAPPLHAGALHGRHPGRPGHRTGLGPQGVVGGRGTVRRPGAGEPAEHHDELAVRAFYPSLHLNLAADYAKLGRPDAARSHLRLARGALATLGDDGYGDGIRAALARLEARLDEAGPGAGEMPGPPRQRP